MAVDRGDRFAKALDDTKMMEITWSLAKEALDHELERVHEQPMEGIDNHFALVGLSENYIQGCKMPFWADVTDNLRNLRKQIVTSLLAKEVGPDEAAMSVKIIDSVLQLPEVARQRAIASREVIRDAEANGVWNGELEIGGR